MNKLWSHMAKRATPYIPGEQLNEPNILKLNTNENPYPPSPKVLEAITGTVGKDLRLYPSPTSDMLTEEIAAYYGLNKENVFVGNGSDEVLAFSFMAFFDPEQTIRFPAITYSFYPVYANVFGISYETVPLLDDFSLDVSGFFETNGGVIFPNPNAPTSVHLPLQQVEDIVKANKGKVVIVDEAYIDFAPEESAASLVQQYNNLLVIQTLSKSRALAGLRLGFALGDTGLIQALTRMKDSFNSYPIDRLAMTGATAAIKDAAYFEKTTAAIMQTREWTANQLRDLGFHVLPSATNFVFATHPDVSAKWIYETLRQHNILIRYFGTEPIDQYVRISIGTDEEMERFADVLKRMLQNKDSAMG